ncbi:FkbM family methyltransferase [Rhodospirillum sp. A1_3_36]|uniref:FkbM family methyltransferase n=1 Tax=Rhodospirillum sp. A1_3_36 TaxID=3391666 RepID=UPI0039A412AE
MAKFMTLMHEIGILNYQNTEVSGERNFCHQYLASLDHPVVLDIGANVGGYSMTCLSGQGHARIFAFEPHPITFRTLEENTARFGIACFNLGMSDQIGTLSLHDYAEEDGSSHASVYREVFSLIHKKPSVSHVVPMSTVDQQVEILGLETIDLLKIDTEGHEMAVLKGAEKTIRANRVNAIQFEFNEHAICARTFFRDFWEFLPEYDFYRLLPGGALHFGFYFPLICETYAFQNIICLKKGIKMPVPVIELG